MGRSRQRRSGRGSDQNPDLVMMVQSFNYHTDQYAEFIAERFKQRLLSYGILWFLGLKIINRTHSFMVDD